MKITFGKYKGLEIDAIIEKDPSYLLWAHDNVSYFSLTEEQLQICKKKKEPKSVYRPFDEEDFACGACGCGGFLEDDYYSESMLEGAFGFCD